MNGLETSGRLGERLVEAGAARRVRLAEHFAAIAFLDRTLAEIYHANAGRFRMKGTARKVFASAWGKALKTLDAIRITCESGFGEDALILARSLVNSTINVSYIGRGVDPDERARDYVASGRIAHRKFLLQFGPLPPGWDKDVDWPTTEERAKRWDNVPIADRAREAGVSALYEQTYRFGSSFEHSDSASLSGFFGVSDVDNQEIKCDPSDDFVELVLACTFQAMAVFITVFLARFGLDETERLGRLGAVFSRLGPARRASV